MTVSGRAGTPVHAEAKQGSVCPVEENGAHGVTRPTSAGKIDRNQVSIGQRKQIAMAAFNSSGEIVWEPTPKWIAESNLTRFMKEHNLSSLEELQIRSTADTDWFWNAVLRDLEIAFGVRIPAWLTFRAELPGRNGA